MIISLIFVVAVIAIFLMLSNEVISTQVFRINFQPAPAHVDGRKLRWTMQDKTSVNLESWLVEVFKEVSRALRRGGREKSADLNKWHQKRESVYHAILLTTQTTRVSQNLQKKL